VKRRNDQLQRLFEAAKVAARESPEAIPNGLKARILAQWRSTMEMDEAWRILMFWFRRALFCASLVMVLSLVWWAQDMTSGPPSDLAIANYEVRSDLMP
jgi:hypothetical protein